MKKCFNFRDLGLESVSKLGVGGLQAANCLNLLFSALLKTTYTQGQLCLNNGRGSVFPLRGAI